jgi:hypothetical protein
MTGWQQRRVDPAGWASLLFALGTVLGMVRAISANPPAWDNFSDTWVATDALGRSVPTDETAGPPRRDRTVAMFYFKWADNTQQTGDASDFTLNGDVAPNDRFNYRARLLALPARKDLASQ